MDTTTATTTATACRLSGRGLQHRYGDTAALAGVDLDVAAGEAVALMGPSGSGKSTLLHVLSGILRPDAGTVRLRRDGHEQEISALGERARSALRLHAFGFVFQEGLLLPELTAEENVRLPLLLAGQDRDAAQEAALAALDDLGLGGRAADRPGQLSGGQAQRVAVARALVGGADVVFADEPTGALDSRTAADVVEVLVSATAGAGRTLVVVTHDPEVAAACTRVVHLRDGRIEESR